MANLMCEAPRLVPRLFFCLDFNRVRCTGRFFLSCWKFPSPTGVCVWSAIVMLEYHPTRQDVHWMSMYPLSYPSETEQETLRLHVTETFSYDILLSSIQGSSSKTSTIYGTTFQTAPMQTNRPRASEDNIPTSFRQNSAFKSVISRILCGCIRIADRASRDR